MKNFLHVHTVQLSEVGAVLAVPANTCQKLINSGHVFRNKRGAWCSSCPDVDEMILRVPGTFIERIPAKAS